MSKYTIGQRVVVLDDGCRRNLIGNVVEIGETHIRVAVQANAMGRHGGFAWFLPDLLEALPDYAVLAGENDRLWRYLADEVPFASLPEWMRDKIYARERAEQEAMASDE